MKVCNIYSETCVKCRGLTLLLQCEILDGVAVTTT